MATTTTRKSAGERREEILEAAMTEFAEHGYEGTSADVIARRAGISQPYLFRLFGTKKELFMASAERCFEATLREFQEASRDLSGQDALEAMGQAYWRLISDDPRKLSAQMQAYVACSDPEISVVVRRGFQRIVEHVRSVGADPREAAIFVARGMLCNVLTSMGAMRDEESWAIELIQGTRPQA